MKNKKYIVMLITAIFILLFSIPVFAGIEDVPDEGVNDETVNEIIQRPTLSLDQNRTPLPTISLRPLLTPTPQIDMKAQKIKKNYADYYFVIEESLRVLEYTADDYNRAVCSGDRGEMKRLKENLNIAVLDADVLMGKLGLYNNLEIWKIYNNYIQNAECGLNHGLIAATKGAMDRLHRQTEYLGLWVPSTGESKYMMENARCQQGLFTAPNGVCLSEFGPVSTKYYHSNGYAMECVWPGYCDRINVKKMDRCDWLDCN